MLRVDMCVSYEYSFRASYHTCDREPKVHIYVYIYACVCVCVRIKNPAYIEYKYFRPCRRSMFRLLQKISFAIDTLLVIGSNRNLRVTKIGIVSSLLGS